MAAQSCRERLRDEVTCSVCLDYFTDPVILDCGHNFCRACIVGTWGEESSPEAACPQCREWVQTSSLKPNRQLANIVEAVKELSEFPTLEGPGWETCERHEEPRTLFCKDDEAATCEVCARSEEHRAHHVVPVEEAAQEYKDHISRSLDILRKERENILLYKEENEKESRDLFQQTEAEREKTTAAFRQLHQFLEEQEKLVLAQMEEVENELASRREEHQYALHWELCPLDSFIREMEQKNRESVSELLQDFRKVLERSKESFKNPVAFPAALKLRIHDFCDRNLFLENVMKQFKATLVSGLQLQKANVTPDPDAVHPQLILSEDCKSLRCGHRC